MGKPGLRLLDDVELDELPKLKAVAEKPKPWVNIDGPWPVVWPDDHSYRDALVITPEGEENSTINEAYYFEELTQEALSQINEIREKFGKILNIIPTRYSRVSEETALFNGA